LIKTLLTCCRVWTLAIFSLTAAILITLTTSVAPRNLLKKRIHYVDVGTSGGVWSLERGYCMMIGGEKEIVTTSTQFSQDSLQAARARREPPVENHR
jgi:hypothetical protein